MTPTPQETLSAQNLAGPDVIESQDAGARPLRGEEVVISGMSGIFPNSDSVLEFKKNLFNQVDMVSSDDFRWKFNHPEVPKHLGKVNGMGKFDAQFFKVHYKQACTMEPMSRKLLEHAYSAIYDAGVNPLQLKGKKVGVFIGSNFSESEKIVIYENVQRNGFGITGCNKAMYANRISYWIDGKGPSYAVDLACASSTACVEHAYRAITSGQCEAAIVGGCNLCMHPKVLLNCSRAGFLCLDGKTKCFDKNADGYVRSDAISVLFLQKSKDAKRIYSEVYYAKSNYSNKINDTFLPLRDDEEIQKFLESFYSDIDVSPRDVEYVEACGSAIAQADANELKAIGEVFAKDGPVKIGCVKSNMGCSEPASGICAVAKACLAYHEGKMPGNLHYSQPHDEIDAVRDGRIQVLTENTKFGRGFTGINTFSYSGGNFHLLLKGQYKPKDPERYKSSIPHLVFASGRKDTCVYTILNSLKSDSVDPEQIALINNIHQVEIPGHMCRGYSILDTNEKKETVCLSQNVEYCPGVARPIWFVYSGMGSQWATMGAELMRIPIFAAAIEKCHRVLEPKGIDIVKILTDPDKSIYENILHSFVGIAAVQIGLTDILTAMGIVPDNIIGHSVGELGCAYADGCFTAEEMILAAYSRGLVSIQTPFIRGSMAAVGLGYKNIQALCPPEIEVACHNSSDSSTISGPADIMKQFVSELTSRGVFAKEVPCSNIAYHSKYIAGAGPGLLKYLSEVIKDPKLRSEKWVSTSVPQESWDKPIAKYSSAEYHTNNLLNSVLFEETSKLIPSNALVIEIAPHGLLQAILKRSLSECVHIPLTRRGHADPVKYLLEAIGKLYQAGLNPKVDVLYPKIEYPVSTETPLLSHLVEWEHSEDWPQAKFNTKDRMTATAREFIMSIHDDDYKYFSGHARDGVYVLPEAACLVIVWETLAMHKGVNYKDMSVVFSNIRFTGEATIRPELPLRLDVMINKGNNKFEVSYEKVQIVSGYITQTAPSHFIDRRIEPLNANDNEILLTTKDVYTIMKLRGYAYKDDFQSIHSSNLRRNRAHVKWDDEWITFLDSLIQFNALSRDHDGVSTPSLIKNICINIDEHAKTERIVMDDVTCMTADRYDIYEMTKCGGVEINCLEFVDKPITVKEPDVLQSRVFVPYFLTGVVDLKTALQVNFQIISDNVSEDKIQVLEHLNASNIEVSSTIKEVTTEIATNQFNIDSHTNGDYDNEKTRKANVIVIDNLLDKEEKLKNLYNIISKNTFILVLEEDVQNISPKYESFNIISAMSVQKQILMLMRKADDKVQDVVYIQIAEDSKFSWIPRVQAELRGNKKVVLISERQPYCGLAGLIKVLRKDYGNRISSIIVDDFSHVPSFNPEHNVFKEQLQKNLTFNIMKKGLWGGYYYLSNATTANVQNLYLTSSVPGDIDSLKWVETRPLSTSNNVVQVCYSSPSFKDAQRAVGKSMKNRDKPFGMDFSGINSKGERVMGVINGGALSSTIEADPDLLWPVPDHWTLEDAATVPLPYLYAYYCLAIRTKLPAGRKVFVNGGAGAFGQAVISICLALNCEVFTTVSDASKKEFLMKLFPELKESNIGHSRVLTFQDSVISNTNNIRCDVVINCLSGTLRHAAMNCVGNMNQILDIGDYDMESNNDFGMFYLIGEKVYSSVRFSTIFKPEFAREKGILQTLISEGIANGTVRPLSRVVYTPANISKAFRLLSSSKHRGKVLIRMNDPENITQKLEVLPRMSCSSKGTYIIVCDQTPLSVELADHLVKRGAKNLLLHTTVDPSHIAGYCYSKIMSWKKQNVTIKISSENLETEKGCLQMLQDGKKLGSILGIFVVQNYSLGVVHDNFQQHEFVGEFNKIVCVVANLDLVSRNICNELAHFVVLNCSPKTAADEYICSTLDKICQARNDVTLPALMLRLGSITEIEENLDNSERKTKSQTLTTLFNALENSLRLKYHNILTYNLKKPVGADFIAKISRILGVKSIDGMDPTYTLKDLMINEINIEEIMNAIKYEYKITYPLERVMEMTIENLKNLDREMITSKKNFNSGLGAFFTFIDEDECMATEPLITMQTKFSDVTEEEELDPKSTYLLLLPGFSGHHSVFTSVCERLKVQALTLQLGPDMMDDSIQQMASNIMKFIKKRIELKSKFYLLGYSFGVNVALELAALFEKEGHVGVVYCLDSSPDALRVHLDAYVGSLTDSQLQNGIVEHMYRLMSGRDSEELKDDLRKSETWSEKVEACVSRLRGIVFYSHQYKRSILQGAYKRIMLAREYVPDFKLKSELVLMKGIPHPAATSLADDYNLSKYTEKPVKVFNIECDHALAPSDCRVANIVNRLLEPKLLEEFKKKNLCDSYLADPFKIL